jgi:diacylglycerol kinase family enzyme
MFPFAEERPERMHLRISTISAAQVVRHAGAIWRGDYDDPSTIFDYLVRDIRVELDPPTAFQIGGDVRGERSHARIALIDKPVRIVDFYSPPSGSTAQV